MKQLALIAAVLISAFVTAQSLTFKGCDSPACNQQKLESLQAQVLSSLKRQSGYITADSLYLEFSVSKEGKVKFDKEFSTSSMLNLIFAKKTLKAFGDSLTPTSDGSYKWAWNISLPVITKSFSDFYETDYFPLTPECGSFNRKAKRGCFEYLMHTAHDELGSSIDEHMTLKLYFKEGNIVAAETPHPPLNKAISDRLILTFNQHLQESTTYTSKKNSDDFWIEFKYSFTGDSITRYTSYINRLEYLSTLKSRKVYHDELLDFKRNHFSKKPKQGALFLIDQLTPLGLDSATPYKIGNKSYTLDSLTLVAQNGLKNTVDHDELVSFREVESVPIFAGCSEYYGDNSDLKNCFQNEILHFVARNFKFPEEARQNKIQGRVYVNFVIQKDGSIGQINIVRGVDPLLDHEAIRVISEIPDMEKPAMQDGKPVRMAFTLPINAKLR